MAPSLSELIGGPSHPAEAGLLADGRDQAEHARPVGPAADGESRRVDDGAGPHILLVGEVAEDGFDGLFVEVSTSSHRSA